MEDPLQRLLLSDAEFARLSLDEKFAYIQKVLRALTTEQQTGQSGGAPGGESSSAGPKTPPKR